jgi:hypothetical protein
MKIFIILNNEKGAVLAIGLMFIALLTIAGTTGYIISSNDVNISANYKHSEQAFNDADAGVQYGIIKLENELKAGGYLPSAVGDTMAIPGGSAPSGYSFALSQLTKDGDNSYSFTSIGNAARGSTTEIKAKIKRGSAIGLGAFGDTLLDSKSFAQYYSYDSRVLSNPSPGDSTGEADVGSNGTVSFNNNTTVDGDVVLGNNGTNDATYSYTGTPNVTGEEGVHVGRVDPDPLNVNGQSFADQFTYYSNIANTKNGNNGGLPADLTVSGSTVTLTSGNYYFTNILVKKQGSNPGIMIIDASGGPVNIYLEGAFETMADCQFNIINNSAANDVTLNITEPPGGIASNQRIVDLKHASGVNENGPPTGFTLKTDSDAILEFKNSSDVNGLIYAPNGNVQMKNSNNVHGAVWADVLEGKNSSILYYDTALRDKYKSNDILMTSWEQVLH